MSNTDSDNVTKLVIPPKTIKETYRKHELVVTYEPSCGEWSWTVTYTTVLKFTGVEKTDKKAIAKARIQIDKLLGDA
jgi:hypothetical protein